MSMIDPLLEAQYMLQGVSVYQFESITLPPAYGSRLSARVFHLVHDDNPLTQDVTSLIELRASLNNYRLLQKCIQRAFSSFRICAPGKAHRYTVERLITVDMTVPASRACRHEAFLAVDKCQRDYIFCVDRRLLRRTSIA